MVRAYCGLAVGIGLCVAAGGETPIGNGLAGYRDGLFSVACAPQFDERPTRRESHAAQRRARTSRPSAR